MNNKNTVLSCMVFVVFLVSLPILFSFNYTDTYLYYGFGEDFPLDITSYDFGKTNANLSPALLYGSASDIYNFYVPDGKLGEWATARYEPGVIGLTDTDLITQPQLPITVSFWFKGSGLTGEHAYPLLSIGTDITGSHPQYGLHIQITNSSDTDYGEVNIITDLGLTCPALDNQHRERTTVNNSFPLDGQYHHVIVQLDGTYSTGTEPKIYSASAIRVFIDAVEYPLVQIAGTGSAGISFSHDAITVQNVTSPCFTNTVYDTDGVFNYLDDLAIYSSYLNQSEIDQLYNNGFGYDPFNTDAPVQTVNIPDIITPLNGDYLIDYKNYYINDINGSIYYTYGGVDKVASFGSSTLEDNFSVAFIDSLFVRFIGFDSEVTNVPMTLEVCNPNGCVNDTFTLSVTGYAFPVSLGDVPDVIISGSGSESLVFSDYFTAYTRRFIQYTDPDGATLTNVTNGFYDVNSCFTARLIGETATFEGNNIACNVTARLIVDDTVFSETSNDFQIAVVPVSIGAVTGFWNSVLDIFPDPSSIRVEVKLIVIIALMLFSVIVLLIGMRDASHTIKGFTIMLLLISELIFFTALGYISIWITLMIFLVSGLAGAGLVARIFMGDAGGGGRG